MDVEVPIRRGFDLRFLWVALGFVLEFLIIPKEIRGTHSVLHEGNLFMSADFYYALLSPIIIWWFFYRLVPSKGSQLDQSRVRLLNSLFGFYLASVIRAILTVFFAIQLGIWTANYR